MYLRRFADANERLVMVPRLDLTKRIPVTVNNACNEVGFYEIPAQDLVDAAEDHDPEVAEGLLADIEGAANTATAEILNGTFPPSDTSRMHLSLFMAVQFTRGWTFRKDLSAMVDLSWPLWLQSVTTPERVKAFLDKTGQRSRPQDVEAFVAKTTGPDGPRVVPRQGNYVSQMFQQSIETLLPSIFRRCWRLLDFGEPMLLTSDEPIAVLQPTGTPVGPVLAPALWFPLDRSRALAMTPDGTEGVVPSGRVRAATINQIIATQAHRWILQNPDDHLLDALALGPRTALVEELVDVRVSGDEVRELRRFIKRPVAKRDAD